MSIGFFGKLADMGRKAWNGLKKGAKAVWDVAKPIGETAAAVLSAVPDQRVSSVGRGIGSAMQFATPIASRLFGSD